MSKRRGPRRQYGAAHQQASSTLIAQHVAQFGWMCPGLDDIVAAHPSRDLVADHNVAGRAECGLTVRCRACNSKRRSLGLG